MFFWNALRRKLLIWKLKSKGICRKLCLMPLKQDKTKEFQKIEINAQKWRRMDMNQAAILTQVEDVHLSQEKQAHLKENIAEGIDLLSDQERLVMSLHYYEELTMAEIAQVLDIKEDKAEEIRVTTLENLLKP